MRKSFLPLCVLILMIALATACSKANPPQSSPEQQKEWIRKDFITEKVSYYTRQNFRFVEKLAVSSQKNGYSVVLTFIPEVGSAPVKQDIYRSMAAYAFGINSFFPEIKSYEFNVLWDERTKEKAIHAVIDEAGVTSLSNRYHELMIDKNGGFEPSYRSFFSESTESEAAKKWAD
ncbi:hypothetical protein [Paenibacillus durus]|uniref:Lipoprotein n=1 Tax=Paenibacillus durus TaxID=44251 RepID=A0A089IR72_PAEDU|nr:hypothetical protein [Paenibacillus durus]AIQ11534.1 hypothetical protein PDUR_05920 [Paenibacillus durus]